MTKKQRKSENITVGRSGDKIFVAVPISILRDGQSIELGVPRKKISTEKAAAYLFVFGIVAAVAYLMFIAPGS